jgi:hypothetical protein
VFTKSNLVDNPHERAKKIYHKLNIDIPYPYVLSFGSGRAAWGELLWIAIDKNSTGEYLLKANYYKIAICELVKTIIVSTPKHFPVETNKKVTREYNNCIEIKRARTNTILGMLAHGIFAVIGVIILGALTGRAGLLGTLAKFGGGVKFGVLVIAGLGLSAGIAVTKFNNADCSLESTRILEQEINAKHWDTYFHQNNAIALQGYFENNVPHGVCTIYDNDKTKLWQGNFINGTPEICIAK